MRIDREKKGVGKYLTPGRSTGQEIRPVSSTTFEQELTQKREANTHQLMKELLQEIDIITQRLSRSLTVNDLMLYKRTVKGFLKEATSLAYGIRQERGRSRRGRTLLITIGVIDKEVDALIDDFMKNKKDPVDILDRMDKIRGMLVDLMA